MRQVSANTTITSAAAGRYAQALFELAEEAGEVQETAAGLDRLGAAIDASGDLARFISSPLHDAAIQAKALEAVVDKLKCGELVKRFVATVAANRRIKELLAMIAAFHDLAARARGEVRVNVTSAQELTATQMKKVSAALKAALGSNVEITNDVDPSILGGLVVRAGSRMIDTSVKTRLNTLKTMLKGM